MKILPYNELQNNRLRNVVCWILSLLFSVPLIAEFVWGNEDSDTSPWKAVTGLAIVVVLNIVQSLIEFQQVLEVLDNKQFTTYFKIGIFKFSRKTYWGPVQVVLEQDEKRFFCVTIKTANKKSLIIEKIPTMKQANARLEEVRALFL